MQKSKKRKKKQNKSATARRRKLVEMLEQVDRAEQLEEDGEAAEAYELLRDLNRQYPRRPEVLQALVNVCFTLNDLPSYQAACEQLVPLQPHDPDLRLGLAGSCMGNMRPALALRHFQVFLERWPNDVRADDVRQTADELQYALNDILDDLGLAGKEGFAIAVLHEQILGAMSRVDLAKVQTLAEELLQIKPDFLPALNNLSEACFRQDHVDRAIAASRRVLEIEPDNFNALGNLARHLHLTGRQEEARPLLDRLKGVESESLDIYAKKAETFSYLGDDQAVLDAHRQAKRRKAESDPRNEAFLCHLAAAATMRLGKERNARKLWKKALKLSPGLNLAQDNLDDLENPPEERHAPWAYDISYWLTDDLAHKVASCMERAEEHESEEAFTREAQRLLQEHPQLAAALPILLERGDPMGRQLALHLATVADSFDILREFALSQYGPDSLRQQAVQTLRQAEVLSAEPVRMWLKGEWRDICVRGFEVSDEPIYEHPAEIEPIAYDAITALKEGDGEEAEHLLKKALEVAPDAPDLLNNLASAYRAQGRQEEGKQLIREIHERFPDYFFGRINMAHLYLQSDDIDRAKEMTEPLLDRPRYHTTEFAGLCYVQALIHVTEEDADAASHWTNMLEEFEPEHPALPYLHTMMSTGKLAWLGRGRKK